MKHNKESEIKQRKYRVGVELIENMTDQEWEEFMKEDATSWIIECGKEDDDE